MRLACLALLLVPVLARALPDAEQVRFESLDAGARGRLVLDARLFVPEGPVPPAGRPAVIALHGCNGMYAARSTGEARPLAARHLAYAQRWVDAGYVVMFPDSLGGRGLEEICTVPLRERRLAPAHRRLDVLGALEWLSRQADVDPSRIALVGWSHGGGTVLATVNDGDPRIAAWRARAEAPPFFRTAVAFYPGCTPARNDARWRPAVPLAILTGASDDWTPAGPCEALGRRAREAGWPLDVEIYPDAHHGFDASSGSVRLLANVPNGVNPGKGVHVGPNARARERALDRLAAILDEALAPRPP